MATDKKKEVKMRDLKPTKDAKGGAARNLNSQTNRSSTNRASTNRASTNRASRNLN